VQIYRFKSAVNKEKTTVKKVLFVLAVAVLFLNSTAISFANNTDGGAGSTGCGQTLCKP
jgi:hypothetical protein